MAAINYSVAKKLAAIGQKPENGKEQTMFQNIARYLEDNLDDLPTVWRLCPYFLGRHHTIDAGSINNRHTLHAGAPQIHNGSLHMISVR